jgi:hypothetical protein
MASGLGILRSIHLSYGTSEVTHKRILEIRQVLLQGVSAVSARLTQ